MLRKKFWLMLGAMTAAAAACSSPLPTAMDTVTTAPSAGQVGSLLSLSTPDISGLIGDLGLNNGLVGRLTCTLGSGNIAINIGDEGGNITLGGVTLSFPKHALSHLTQIIMIPVPGNRPSVKFLPEGLHFNPQALPTLTMNTECIGNPAHAVIVYTDDAGRILENEGGFHTDSHSISAKIGHFSRYAVDW